MAEPDHSEQLGFPDLDAGPDGDDDLENQSGLGKGLSAIIPQLAGLDSSSRSPRSGGGIASLIPDSGADEDVAATARESSAGDGGPTDEGAAPTDVESEDAGAAAGEAEDSGDVEPDDGEAGGGVDPDESGDPLVDRGRDIGSVRQLRDDLIRALLDGLVNTMRLDLCAYVHVEVDGEPELFLRSPALSSLGPRRVWDLFAVLREAAAAERSVDDFHVAGMQGLVAATGGSGSTGIFALARVDGLGDEERAVSGRFCASFGRAVHQLAGDRIRLAHTDRLGVEVHETRDSILARVQVAAGNTLMPGTGRATTRVEAVTRAVLDAHDVDAVFRYASEVSHGEEHAAVVLLESQDGAFALGSAVTDEAGSRATAYAARRAITALIETVAQPT
jgi:hypothetical protein